MTTECIMNTAYTYEIEFDILRSSRTAYEQWLAQNAIDWVSHQAVSSFAVEQNRNGLSPEIKFRFGFPSLERWATFTDSDIHQEATETLREVSAELSGTLWEQGGIRLGEDSTAQNPQLDDPPISDPVIDGSQSSDLSG